MPLKYQFQRNLETGSRILLEEQASKNLQEGVLTASRKYLLEELQNYFQKIVRMMRFSEVFPG